MGDGSAMAMVWLGMEWLVYDGERGVVMYMYTYHISHIYHIYHLSCHVSIVYRVPYYYYISIWIWLSMSISILSKFVGGVSFKSGAGGWGEVSLPGPDQNIFEDLAHAGLLLRFEIDIYIYIYTLSYTIYHISSIYPSFKPAGFEALSFCCFLSSEPP